MGTAVFLAVLAAYAIILMYIFPLLPRFDNTVWAMFKNSLMVGMRFIWCTALMALVYFAMVVVVVRVFTPAVIFGVGLCALLCSYLLVNIFGVVGGRSKGRNGGESGEEEEDSYDNFRRI